MNETKIEKWTTLRAEKLYSFVRNCPPLDIHSAFTYWVLQQYQSNYCFAAIDKNQHVVGIVSGILNSENTNTVYLWQLGVVPDFRNTRLASRLILTFFRAVKENNIKYIEFSIDQNNKRSMNSALRFAKRYDLRLQEVGRIYLQSDETEKVTFETLFRIKVG